MENIAARICLLTPLFLLILQPAGTKPQMHAPDPCLPPSEFALAGVNLGLSEPAVRKALGEPKMVTREKGEDDGGAYTVTVLDYPRLRVEVVRGVVDRLYADSPGARTPSGVRPGMKFDDVRKVLGAAPKAVNICPRCYSYGSCDESTPARFELKFDYSMTLSSIDISADRP